MTESEIKEIVKKEIKIITFKIVQDNDSLLKSGILNSIAAVDLSIALEGKFAVQIPFVDINEQYFGSLEKIINYLNLKLKS